MLPTRIVSASSESPSPERPTPAGRRGGRPIAIGLRVILVCGLLVAAGGLRLWQERRVEAQVASGLIAPFPLAELPLHLGDWQGQQDQLDPRIARVAGSVDNTQRIYVNQRTGVRLEAIVLYGPAASLYPHPPEVCYPAAGYRPVGEARWHEIDLGDGQPPAQFLSLVYARGEGGQTAVQEVFYAWRYRGRWSPRLDDRKVVERVPSMFKIHVARPITPGELRDVANPSRDFAALLTSQIERRLAEASAGPRTSVRRPPDLR